MKERAYPVYTVNKHAEGLLVGGHPWVYENDITAAPETLPERVWMNFSGSTMRQSTKLSATIDFLSEVMTSLAARS